MEQVPKIVQQRLRSTAKPGAHLDADLLTAFAENLLGEHDRTQVLGHLADCALCRETVRLANVAKNEAQEAYPLPAARSRWLTWPVLRWGTLAACVVVVGSAVTLHYEWRAGKDPHAVAEISAPAAAPPTVRLENQDSTQLRQKLAAKVAPPLPYQSEGDFGAAGKLAKQPETMKERTVDHLKIDRVQPSRTRANEPATDQAARNELANSVPAASADKAPATVRQQAAAAAISPAPAPVPAPALVSPPAAKTPDAELEAKKRSDLEDKVGTATETVTGEAEAPQIATQSASAKSVDRSVKDEEAKRAQKAPAGLAGGMRLGDRKGDMTRSGTTIAEAVEVQSKKSKKQLRARANAAPRWTLSSEGGLLRSFDAGQTWQTVAVAPGVLFRALAANDSDIWAGGTAGALYHCSDAGQHWTEIKPVAAGKPLTASIIHIEFEDPQHGKLTTDNGETWITRDAGRTWRIE